MEFGARSVFPAGAKSHSGKSTAAPAPMRGCFSALQQPAATEEHQLSCSTIKTPPSCFTKVPRTLHNGLKLKCWNSEPFCPEFASLRPGARPTVLFTTDRGRNFNSQAVDVNSPVTVRNRAGNATAGAHPGRCRRIDIGRRPRMIGPTRFNGERVLQSIRNTRKPMPLRCRTAAEAAGWLSGAMHIGALFKLARHAARVADVLVTRHTESQESHQRGRGQCFRGQSVRVPEAESQRNNSKTLAHYSNTNRKPPQSKRSTGVM